MPIPVYIGIGVIGLYSLHCSSSTSLIAMLRWLTGLDDSPRSRVQESLANAKVSAQQHWYIGCDSLNRPPLRIAQQYQRNLYIIEKHFQCTTIPSLTMRVYLHWFSCCCLPNMPTSAKFTENLNVQQFKVIQGRWFWYESKAHMRVPISD